MSDSQNKNYIDREITDLANKALSLANAGNYLDSFKLFEQALNRAIELNERGLVDNITIEWLYYNLEALSYKMNPPQNNTPG